MVHSGEKVISRGGKHIGFTTGAVRSCNLTGCRGVQIVVKWDNKKITYLCSKGMERNNDVWQIL